MVNELSDSFRITTIEAFADEVAQLPLQPELPLGILREVGNRAFRGKENINPSKQRELRSKYPSELPPEEIAQSIHAWLGLINITDPKVIGVVNMYVKALAAQFHTLGKVQDATYLRGENGRLLTIVRRCRDGSDKLQVLSQNGYGISGFSRRAFPKRNQL